MRRGARGLPALADDSGLCVDALGGAPGVYSARYARASRRAQDAAQQRAACSSELRGVADRRALLLLRAGARAHADDPEPLIADGRWHGEIIDAPRGDGGFGYDPHFFDAGAEQTRRRAARRARRTRAVHRGQALRALVARLRGLIPIERRRPPRSRSTPSPGVHLGRAAFS